MQLLPRIALAAGTLIILLAYALGVDVGRFPARRSAVTFTDRGGATLGTLLASDSAHAVAVPLDRVSPSFLSAIVAAEDARYWQHGAIDLRSLARAARDFAIYGEARDGGSTIAMQLARLLHPVPSTWRGKLLQIAVAERIAVASSKSAILEAYVNRAPMGGDLYGVEAAARTYFGEPASDLDLAQATMLAAIPNDPTHLAPDVDRAALRVRQRYVLDRMVALGSITRAQAQQAWDETLRPRRHDNGISDAPHALFALFPTLATQTSRVRTTIDRGLQRFVSSQTGEVLAALSGYHVDDAAALVVDNHTGEVLAYVGSPDYFSDAMLGRNDGVRALRQPGSSLKPFTYELALERGTIAPTTILPDTPATYAIAGGKLYQPSDYSGRFSGPVRVRFALANSLNLPAVYVLSQLGVGTLLDRLHALGFTHLDRAPSYYGLGLTLGGGEVTLWELTQAYATMARGGDPISIHLTGAAQPRPPIGDASTWALVTDMLADDSARSHDFGSHSVLDLPFPSAVKTGTSSDFRDTWTVGFSRDYTVGVWVGNFDGSAMRGVSGVTGAGPLWNRIMLHLHELRDPPAFPKPRGYVRATICATTGRAPARDCLASVQEWVRARDLATIKRALPADTGGLQIIFPHDGDVFVVNHAANALEAREQRIALRAVDAGHSVQWSVAGATLAGDATGTPFWPLRVGTWTLQARAGDRSRSVTIHVVPARANLRPGFTRD